MENYATKNTDVFLSARRFPEYEEIGICRREPFQRDRDRIMHSRSFRRMMHKTQIFNANMGDHYRNRLTHTLEVAQISRSIGKVLGLNDELIEAIALGHDLGHTPFGHIGERTLDGILHNGLNTNIPATGGRFKHNFQSLKVVDQLETRCEDYAGINLTLATREGILKHTKTAYGIAGEMQDFCHSRFAGMAPIRSTVGVAQQVNVHGDSTGRQIELQQLVGHGETILRPLPAHRRPGFAHSQPPPFVCCTTHSINLSFGTTIRLPMRRVGKSFSCISS